MTVFTTIQSLALCVGCSLQSDVLLLLTEDAEATVNLLDESLSLTDLARSLHAEQWRQHESAAAVKSTTAAAALQSQQGPLVQLMQTITGQDNSALTGSALTCHDDSALTGSALTCQDSSAPTGQDSSAGSEMAAKGDSALADSADADSALTGLSPGKVQQAELAHVEEASSVAHVDADVGPDAPSAAQPSSDGDTATQAAAGQSSIQLDSAMPVKSQPDDAHLSKSISENVIPGDAQPHAAQSRASEPDITAVERGVLNGAQPGTAQPDGNKPHAVQPDACPAHFANSEAVQLNVSQPDEAHQM